MPRISGKHADGLQLGAVNPATGNITIHGNYFDPQVRCGATATYYMANGDVVATIESNRLTTWGAFTLWASDVDIMHARYNIYDPVWEAQAGNRCGCSGSSSEPCCSYPERAARYNNAGGASSSFVCNRYQSDGDFIEQEFVTCEDSDDCVLREITGCPDYP